MSLVDDDEIVKITCHRAHWKVARSDFQTADPGNLVRQDGQLNLTRHFQFVVYLQELSGQLFAGFTKHEMGVHPRFHHCRRERLVDIIYRSNLEPVRFVIGFRFPGKKNHWYIFGFWCGFQNSADFVAVHLRHGDIQQDQVRMRFSFYQVQSLCTTSGNPDFEVVFQNRTHHLQVGRSIVHDQHKFLFIRCGHFDSSQFALYSFAISSNFFRAPSKSNSSIAALNADSLGWSQMPARVPSRATNDSAALPSHDSMSVLSRAIAADTARASSLGPLPSGATRSGMTLFIAV